MRYPDWPRLAHTPTESDRLAALRENAAAATAYQWRELVFALFGLMERATPSRLAEFVFDDLWDFAHTLTVNPPAHRREVLDRLRRLDLIKSRSHQRDLFFPFLLCQRTRRALEKRPVFGMKEKARNEILTPLWNRAGGRGKVPLTVSGALAKIRNPTTAALQLVEAAQDWGAGSLRTLFRRHGLDPSTDGMFEIRSRDAGKAPRYFDFDVTP